MGFYKNIPILKRFSMFKYSLNLRLKDLFDNLLWRNVPLKTIFNFKTSTLGEWIFVNDKIFGGTSTCFIEKKPDSCSFFEN
jgi:hypothetical protein